MKRVISLPQVDPNSMAARIFLSFLGTAGLYYVNIMPALVEGLKVGLGFTNQQAGMIGSFNMYGGATGALLAALFVRRLPWRRAAHWMLFGLILVDIISIAFTQPLALMVVRFLHGIVGGGLVGLSFSLFARTHAPDRTFGVLLMVQAAMGGLGVMTLPLLVPILGIPVLFAGLILFSLMTLVMLQFLSDYPVPVPVISTAKALPVMLAPLLLALFSVFLFQAANMGLYAFIIGLGKHLGLELEFISETLGLANWVGVLGALLVVLWSTQYGIFKPILGGMLLTLLGSWALFYSDVHWIWISANFITGMTWNFVIAYLLGMCARFDQAGHSAVWAGFVSKLGLASGPMLGSFLLGENHYATLIWVSLALFLIATVVSAVPAFLLDRRAEKEVNVDVSI